MKLKSLEKVSGLPIFISPAGMVFGGQMCSPSVEIKSYKKYKSFFYQKRLDKNKELYYIYRNSCLEKDSPVFKKYGLRYDITVILPGSIGKEPIRTIGHVHKNLKNTGRPAEIYQIISGNAIFLLHDTDKNIIYRIKRRSGQKIVIPGYCAHITINQSSKEPLVVANIFIDKKNVSDYKFFEKTNGPSWYPIRHRNKIIFEKNPNGDSMTMLAPSSKNIPLPKAISNNASLYKEFIGNPKKFSFLKNSKDVVLKSILK
jgi:glucose-6-phosphate isomerase